MNCRDCEHARFFLWLGDGYSRQVVSCSEYLPVNMKRCRKYNKKRDKE